MTEHEMEQINLQFAQLNQRFDQVDKRFDQVDQRLGRLEVKFEEQQDNLKQVAEAIQISQRVMVAKIDAVHETLARRIDPLELVVRDHSATLADHGNRLVDLENKK